MVWVGGDGLGGRNEFRFGQSRQGGPDVVR